MESENGKQVRLDPVKELGIIYPEHFSWELCRIFEENDERYMYYAVREYPRWMNGKYNDWFLNYREDDDFVPGMAMAVCAFFGPAEEEGVIARRLAKEYIYHHYRETHFLPDLYLLFFLMLRKQFADMITPDIHKKGRIIGYCLREVYNYENRCFRYPEKDIIIISRPLLQLKEGAYDFFYEKYVLDAPPFTPEEETEIKNLLGINSDDY